MRRNEQPEKSGASWKAIRAALPRASDEFVLQCLERDLTVAEARAKYLDELDDDAAGHRAEADSYRRQGDIGVDPVSEPVGAAGFDGDPIESWESALASERIRCRGDNGRAVLNLVHREPQMHRAYLAAYNEQFAASRKGGRRW